ncbi:MAG: hypothetical protein ACREMT_01885, partial [Vulcanimicrobiaceae bacterium]
MKLTSGIMKTIGAATIAGVLALGAMPKPAAADEGTTNTIIAAAAAIALGLTAANVSHKNAVANTVEGYTSDGSTVYQDGHVVLPNGQSYYPGNYGQSISCDGGNCGVSGGNGYYGNGSYGYNGQGSYR